MSLLNFDEFLCHNLSLHSVKYLKNLLSAFCQFLPSYLLRDHPYITSPYGLGGWVKKMAISADVQYCIYSDIVGGSKICEDVIYEWSLPHLPTYIPHMHKQEQSHDAYSHIVQNLHTMFKNSFSRKFV